MKPKLWWIKERYNPQLGTYWVPCGQMSKTAAKRHERPLYGANTMHAFDTEKTYKAKIAELRKRKEYVREPV